MKSNAQNFPANLSTPINRTARNVVSRGVHHSFEQKEKNRAFWETPPPLAATIPEHIKPLINTRKGNLVCVGYLGTTSKRRAKLLVRCDCGKYEVRLANKWRTPQYSCRCQFCEQLTKLRHAHLSFEERDRIEKATLHVPKKIG